MNKGCHTCMIKHTMHVQSVHCSAYLTWLDVCIYVPRSHFGLVGLNLFYLYKHKYIKQYYNILYFIQMGFRRKSVDFFQICIPILQSK